MKLLQWMLATVLILDAALVMTVRAVPTTSPVQSVGLSVGADSVAALSGAGLAR